MTATKVPRTISADELSAMRPRPRIVDVREPAEFNGPLGHVRGAELVPLATIEVSAGAWCKTEPLVVVCRSGARSAKAARLLCGLGFCVVFDLTGGTQAHVGAGHPVERE